MFGLDKLVSEYLNKYSNYIIKITFCICKISS